MAQDDEDCFDAGSCGLLNTLSVAHVAVEVVINKHVVGRVSVRSVVPPDTPVLAVGGCGHESGFFAPQAPLPRQLVEELPVLLA